MKEKHYLAVPFWLAGLFCIQLFCTGAYVLYKISGYQYPPDTPAGRLQEMAGNIDEHAYESTANKLINGQKVVFNLTGDTVVILGKSNDLNLPEGEYWKVVYKDENGMVTEQSLPAEALLPLDSAGVDTD